MAEEVSGNLSVVTPHPNCRQCGGPVIRREGETIKQFSERPYCSRPCQWQSMRDSKSRSATMRALHESGRMDQYAEATKDKRVALVENHGELLKSLPRFRNFTWEDHHARIAAFGPSPAPGYWKETHRDAIMHARSSASFAA